MIKFGERNIKNTIKLLNIYNKLKKNKIIIVLIDNKKGADKRCLIEQ